MRYYISHRLKYTYSIPVFLEPLTIRLRPRSDSVQQVLQFKLKIVPAVEGISEHIDQECNNAANLWFGGKHKTLSISVTSEVNVLKVNPFNFIVTENNLLNLPVTYPQSLQYYLQPYIDRRYQSSQIDDFVKPVLKATKGETIKFLTELTIAIGKNFRKEVRDEGAPKAPEVTIAERNGACRDLAVLFMESCRAVGLAARFVSGYGWNQDLFNKQNMHAWTEVYLPGGGWRGFDPSTGLAVDNRYVAVAAAAEPGNAAPVSGTFRGTGVDCHLEYNVSIRLNKQIVKSKGIFK